MRDRFEDADRLARTPAHEAVLDALAAGIAAADPATAVKEAVTLDDGTLTVGEATYELADYDEVLVLGGGKAAGAVAAGLEAILGDRLDGGVIVVAEPVGTAVIDDVVGGHPLPDAGSVAGARELVARAEAADERTLVLAVVTGGGSAMLAAPAAALTLEDLRATTGALLEAGVAIDEINAVRTHLSAIKGGGLARAAAPATVVGLLVSDVVGDDPGVIASGPTAPDPSTYADALGVLDRDTVEVPPVVRRRLEAGAAGEHPETPAPGDPVFDEVRNEIVVTGWTAIGAARSAVSAAGYTPCVLSARVRGEAREAALAHVAIAEEVAATGNPLAPPAALLSGGETTVTVRGGGSGGPNLEFALRAAMELPEGAVLGSVDTDGADGSTAAAGAIVDGTTVEDPASARGALGDNDAYGYLEARETLLVTGATGTNVNDLRVLVVPD